MAAKVAINGLGRIGRAALELVVDTPELELVAVNDIGPLENMAYLLKYDTVYGPYARSVEIGDGDLVVGGARIAYLGERDPARLPWSELGVELVFECTGLFTTALCKKVGLLCTTSHQHSAISSLVANR